MVYDTSNRPHMILGVILAPAVCGVAIQVLKCSGDWLWRRWLTNFTSHNLLVLKGEWGSEYRVRCFSGQGSGATI